MIINFIVDSMLSVLKLIFGILPNVPAIPTAISDGGTWITDQISSVIGVLNMVYGQTLMAAIMVVVIAMFSFDWVYHTAMWIIRKIPVINIK